MIYDVFGFSPQIVQGASTLLRAAVLDTAETAAYRHSAGESSQIRREDMASHTSETGDEIDSANQWHL